MEAFDLLEYQKVARETCCPKKLFELWEDVCMRFERHEIGRYQLEEMKEVIWPNLKALSSLKNIVNESGTKAERAIKKKVS